MNDKETNEFGRPKHHSGHDTQADDLIAHASHYVRNRPVTTLIIILLFVLVSAAADKM